MKLYFLTMLAAISGQPLFGQGNGTWVSFWNQDTTLIGYKDKNGSVKIAPKFTGFANAVKFDDIIAVTEEVDGQWKNYYLTKSGKITGRNSLHIFDNGSDCESEGFIRFRDKTTDKVGMFNRNGDIVIPAAYNELSRVKNGMIVALKGATKKYWDKEKHSGCNHYNWTGGEEVLLDTLNNILVENFSYDGRINFLSLEKSKAPYAAASRVSFLAKDGSYYSFVDFTKEFKQWLISDLLVNLTSEKLARASYDTITWESKNGWSKSHHRQFIKNNFTILNAALLQVVNSGHEHAVFVEGLNPYVYEGPEFEKYFTNCGEAKEWMYPVMNIVVTHRNKKDISQNQFEFLRTDNGYKLIGVIIRNERLK